MTTLSIVGLLFALVLLTVLTMKGVNIFITAICCVIIVALTGGLTPMDALMDPYMTGFTTYFKNYFFLFLSGSIFGKLMETTNGAKAIAELIVRLLGRDRAAIAVPVAIGILCYGGVNVFTSMFCVFPIALEVFRASNVPRRFLAGTIFFGAATFAMVAPGTPQIQNFVPCNAVGVPLMAGVIPGFVGCGSILIIGSFLLDRMIKKAWADGEKFEALPVDSFDDTPGNVPNGIQSLIPLALTLILINFQIDGAPLFRIETGVFIGCAIILIVLNKYVEWPNLLRDLGDGAKNTVFMIANTCAVVGFGTVVKAVPAFEVITNAVLNIPGPPLIGVGIGTTVVCGITGSASGGLGIAAPVLGPLYVSQGVNPEFVARIMALSSCALDSLPHNGAVVSLITGICNDTHKNAYMPVFWLTVVTPAIGTVITVIVATLLS